MKEVIRCSNCGEEIRKLNSTCVHCGYKRHESRQETVRYEIFINRYRGDRSRLYEIFNRELNLSPKAAREHLTKIPGVVWETMDRKIAQRLASELTKTGADAGWRNAHKGFDENTTVSDGEKSGKEKILVKVVPFLLIFVAIMMSIISENADRIRFYYKKISSCDRISFYQGQDFNIVRVVIARKAIEEGTKIDESMLTTASYRRDEIPGNAIAPLNVDKILGVVAEEDISAGSIIVLD